MPTALRLARDVATTDEPSRDERRWLVLDFDAILGLDLDKTWDEALGTAAAELPTGAEELMAARSAARAARDFVAADRLREQLRGLGVEPIDRADGSSDWRPLASRAASDRPRP